MAGITQSGQKCLIFIVVPQIRNANGSGFVKNDKHKKKRFASARLQNIYHGVRINSVLSFRRFFQNVEPYDNLMKYSINDIPNKFIFLTFST